ncbi:hypothetical protein BD779DRAFT_1613432 [Infundibulicybe gibba]|nr:hypothetical protein BD779DRAFT_1613432 [Infundibulicybe gibba]
MPQSFKPRDIPCPVSGCFRLFTNRSGLTNHTRTQHACFGVQTHLENESPPPISSPGPSVHANPTPDSETELRSHPFINGKPCDRYGNTLPEGSPPPPPLEYSPLPNDFTPYNNQAEFELADLLYRRTQMPATQINDLLQIWATTLPANNDPLFVNKQDLYDTIDLSPLGGVPWESFGVSYNGDMGDGDSQAPWKKTEYDVWFRDPQLVLQEQLKNPDFAKEMDFAPKRVFDPDGKRCYTDFMSGNWCWRHADMIAKNRDNHGSTFCLIILGSDKTTVSVATGQNEYYPLYMSNGLVHNNVWQAHRNAVSLIGFLAVPKTNREHQDSEEFRNFRWQLFHGSIRRILEPLRLGMETPEIVQFGDGHYCRVIYGIGPYIADYPEQVLLTCIVQGWCLRCGGRQSHEHTLALFDALGTKALWKGYGIVNDIMPFTYGFPRADIHELVTPDLLHQVIKGTFKTISIMAAPSFPGLWRFPEGRGFKQWTGDDSKALMKVYLPAISGHIPLQMVRTVSSFVEFCYLVRRSIIDGSTLAAIDLAVADFHREQSIFEQKGICPNGFSLPRQHLLPHYRHLTQEFGAPNGLCSSITESKHIKAVKEPWRRSSRFEALGQMLIINQCLDKLAAMCVNFQARGMLNGPLFDPISLPEDGGSPVNTTDIDDGANNKPSDSNVDGANDELDSDADDNDGGGLDSRNIIGEVKLARVPFAKIPRNVPDLAHHLGIPQLRELIRLFLFQQYHPNSDLNKLPPNDFPYHDGHILAFPSAITTFFAPSDYSGIGGMYREQIRATPSWRLGPPRYDCIFVEQDPEALGFHGLHAACVLLFFSFRFETVLYPCALVTWFSAIGEEPCPNTRMWRVKPDLDANGEHIMEVIHIDCILRVAHLLGDVGEEHIPHYLTHSDSLDAFKTFYVNKFADHHAHEIAF